jgi:hypothetical protein
MSSTKVWWAIGNALNGDWFYDNIGDIANYSFIVLGFFGLFYWLWTQKKLNDKAANTPGQIK